MHLKIQVLLMLLFVLCSAHSTVAQTAEQHFWTLRTGQPQTAESAAMLTMQFRMQQARAQQMQQAMLFNQMQQQRMMQEKRSQQSQMQPMSPVRAGEKTTGFVDRIIDGDTFVLTDGRRVRLHGVDAPEADQEYGREASAALHQMLAGHIVDVEFINESYDRGVAKVMVLGNSVNLKMVAEGHAWYEPKYAPRERELEMAQERAKIIGLGLWLNPIPQRPEEFRRGKSMLEPVFIP